MKLGQWMMMLSGMILFLSLIGLEIPGLNPINQAIGLNVTNGTTVSADLESSTIFSALFGSGSEAIQLFGISLTSGILLSLLAGGVVTAGLYVATKDSAILILPILIIIAGLYASTFVSVVSYFDVGWARNIAVSIFGILSIGFLMSILDYFLNR
jgi:hypothetical protein